MNGLTVSSPAALWADNALTAHRLPLRLQLKSGGFHNPGGPSVKRPQDEVGVGFTHADDSGSSQPVNGQELVKETFFRTESVLHIQ